MNSSIQLLAIEETTGEKQQTLFLDAELANVPRSDASWLRACFTIAALLLIASAALFSYRFAAEQQLLLECKGDKRLLRKKKRGSAYVDIEGTSTASTSYNFMRCTKTWTSDSEAPYHKLM